MRTIAGALLVVALLAALAGPALAVKPRASLPDIEDEVMCVECRTPLNLSKAPVADRERAFIRREIARGKTKQQIKDELVASFGPSVLAQPEDEGFGLAAYLVPAVLILLALLGVGLAARRWRRPRSLTEPASEIEPEDARRLERELSAFDRRAGPGG